ncbi:uncharacterized protein LOC111909549 [Lactuca sativa]|uniref:uncharacterized protein LOC111909549 n=1 Tax=Lactuca sativa TaxID=4236 RepID=UPI000CD99783|nr:uncharacterized protein LOC111909549 [Lactuca sativa]
MGHLKANCPQLASRAVQVPPSAVFHITNGWQGKAEASRARGRAFQLIVEEAHAAPDLVAGKFLVNFVPALVLFDLGASQSFVLLSFSRSFSIPLEALSRPLRVSILDEHSVSASKIHRDYSLEIFGIGYQIDLIPIPIGDVSVIVGMDWLGQFGDLIDYER